MKILIINQHAGNHGDEAAGKGLLKGLKQKIDFANNKISVLYNKNTIDKLEKIDDNQYIDHYSGNQLNKIEKIIAICCFILPFKLGKMLIKLSPILSREYKLIDESDKIINAPGGVNIGPYKDWRYLWRLFVSLKLKKDVAIYSISFGPLPENFLFRNISLYVLKNAKFFSIRDKQSQSFAAELGINYIASIDTAFIGYEDVTKLPENIDKLIDNDYVVIVPNELHNWGNRNKWHHNFKNCNKNDLDEIYISLIKYILSLNKKVYLLPQLYGTQNDVDYFHALKNKISNNNIIVIDEKYNSNIQQTIVKNAKFLIGARYHSIIFALNNKVPFLSLSYEHKMKNTLEILGLENNNLDLVDLLTNKNINTVKKLENLLSLGCKCFDNPKSNSANEIAQDTMEKLYKFIDN
jgi:colanic acid/amylovoran biosynthesis protein